MPTTSLGPARTAAVKECTAYKLRSNKVITAIKVCRICNEHLCRKCINYHRSSAATSAHRIEDFATQTAQGPSDVNTVVVGTPAQVNKRNCAQKVLTRSPSFAKLTFIVVGVAIIVGYLFIGNQPKGNGSRDVSLKNPLFEKVQFLKAVTKEDIGIDRTGNYFDVEFLPDGKLVLADFENSKLLLLNQDFTLHSEVNVGGEPSGISIDMRRDDIYVTCDRGFILRYRRLKDKWEVKKVHKYIWARDVSSVINNTIILTKYNKIIFYDLSNRKVVKTLQKKTGYNYLALSDDQNTFVYTDGDAVIGRDTGSENSVKFKYKHAQLDTPRGVCIDHHDNIYVVGQLYNNVHQVSPDGKTSRILVDDLHTITLAYGIAFHPKRNLFVVTSDDEDVIMEVYEFKD